MLSVLIFGAGSIGNHLSHACREQEWAVDLFDIDAQALERTKNEIYPSRYGAWDPKIILLDEIDYEKKYDLVIVGTPPDSHESIAHDVLRHLTPKILLIEKPLCTPDLRNIKNLVHLQKSKKCRILIGYNHIFTTNTQRASELLLGGSIGTPLTLHARWTEHWGGIFAAHPWLNGPIDSYLGFWRRGGGACGEHSHAISLWLHFATLLGAGEVSEVTASLDFQSSGGVEYDQTAQLILKTEKGLVGSVIQDVVTSPPEKMLRIQGTHGYLEWYANFDNHHDAIRYALRDSEEILEKFPKTRIDDFRNQITHIEQLMDESIQESPNDLDNGIEVMKVITAAYLSNRVKQTIFPKKEDLFSINNTLSPELNAEILPV